MHVRMQAHLNPHPHDNECFEEYGKMIKSLCFWLFIICNRNCLVFESLFKHKLHCTHYSRMLVSCCVLHVYWSHWNECLNTRVRVWLWLDYYAFYLHAHTHKTSSMLGKESAQRNTFIRTSHIAWEVHPLKITWQQNELRGWNISANKPRPGASGHLFSNGIFHSSHSVSVWRATAYLLPRPVMIAFCRPDCVYVVYIMSWW